MSRDPFRRAQRTVENPGEPQEPSSRSPFPALIALFVIGVIGYLAYNPVKTWVTEAGAAMRVAYTERNPDITTASGGAGNPRAIRVGDQIFSGASPLTMLSVSDDTSVRLRPGTQISIDSADSGSIHLTLHEGDLWVDQGSKVKVTIEVPVASVGPLGQETEVSFDGPFEVRSWLGTTEVHLNSEDTMVKTVAQGQHIAIKGHNIQPMDPIPPTMGADPWVAWNLKFNTEAVAGSQYVKFDAWPAEMAKQGITPVAVAMAAPPAGSAAPPESRPRAGTSRYVPQDAPPSTSGRGSSQRGPNGPGQRHAAAPPNPGEDRGEATDSGRPAPGEPVAATTGPKALPDIDSDDPSHAAAPSHAVSHATEVADSGDEAPPVGYDPAAVSSGNAGSRPSSSGSFVKVGMLLDPKSNVPIGLTADGDLAERDAVIVASIYPKGYNKSQWWSEGDHEYYPIAKGSFSYSRKFDPARYNGGAYEIGVYTKKVFLKDCQVVAGGCFFCKKFGYHLEGQVAYKTGLIAPISAVPTASSGPKNPGAPNYADLQLRVVTDAAGQPVKLWVGVNAPAAGYVLSRSLWANGADLNKEANNQYIEVPPGKSSYDFPLSSEYTMGYVNCTLWTKKVPKEACTLAPGGCYFCNKYGFHMEGWVMEKGGKLLVNKPR